MYVMPLTQINVISDHFSDLDNFIAISNSLMDLFWAYDASNTDPDSWNILRDTSNSFPDTADRFDFNTSSHPPDSSNVTPGSSNPPPNSSNYRPINENLQGLVVKHNIEKDVSAFCYTFAVLLRLASDEDIAERKEKVREISSRILKILPSEGDTEFVAQSNRTTSEQLYCTFWLFDTNQYGGIVDRALVPRLNKLWRSVNEGHRYNHNG